jgi:hypothetical protein
MKPAFKESRWREAGKLIDQLRYCKTCRQQTPTKVSFKDADIHYNISFYPEPDGQVGIDWHSPVVDCMGYWSKVVCEHCGTDKSQQLLELLHKRLSK